MPLRFAIVPRRCRSVFAAFCALLNGILETKWHQLWEPLIWHINLECCG